MTWRAEQEDGLVRQAAEKQSGQGPQMTYGVAIPVQDRPTSAATSRRWRWRRVFQRMQENAALIEEGAGEGRPLRDVLYRPSVSDGVAKMEVGRRLCGVRTDEVH